MSDRYSFEARATWVVEDPAALLNSVIRTLIEIGVETEDDEEELALLQSGSVQTALLWLFDPTRRCEGLGLRVVDGYCLAGPEDEEDPGP